MNYQMSCDIYFFCHYPQRLRGDNGNIGAEVIPLLFLESGDIQSELAI